MTSSYPSTVSSAIFTGNSDTTYLFALTTTLNSGSVYSATTTVQATTYPAALSNVIPIILTSTSVTIEFSPSSGAGSYSYLLFAQRFAFFPPSLPEPFPFNFVFFSFSFQIHVLFGNFFFVYGSTGQQLTQGYLSTTPQGLNDSATISNIIPNTAYTVRIYAMPETVGYPFQITTFPSRESLK